jgi:hypothetical protein
MTAFVVHGYTNIFREWAASCLLPAQNPQSLESNRSDAAGGRRSRGTTNSRVENPFFRCNTIIGSGLHARYSKSQEAEALRACNILSRMIAIGRRDSFALGA